MSGQTVSMKKIAFLLSVSVGMSTGAVTVPLLYPHILPTCPDGTVQLCLGVSAGDWLLAGAELSDGERVRIQQGV